MSATNWNGTMQQERLIRKYTNRRLYDTVGSRHVTLEDLRQLIVTGEKIKVVDDKSGEDLTRSVLLQIISEQEQFGSPVLGSELLEMIIRFYGGPMQALLSRYLEQAFTTMLRQQEAMQVEMAKALQTPFAPLTELTRKNLEMWSQMQAATREAFGGRAGAEPKAPDHGEKPKPEVGKKRKHDDHR
jgi:polyhydroxyalkanoate synthesis repressor PhaR